MLATFYFVVHYCCLVYTLKLKYAFWYVNHNRSLSSIWVIRKQEAINHLIYKNPHAEIPLCAKR